jgi:hypothetical protein
MMAEVWVSSSQNIASACLAAIFFHRLLFFSSNLCLIWQQQDMQFSVGQTIQENMLTSASALKMEAAVPPNHILTFITMRVRFCSDILT